MSKESDSKFFTDADYADASRTLCEGELREPSRCV